MRATIWHSLCPNSDTPPEPGDQLHRVHDFDVPRAWVIRLDGDPGRIFGMLALVLDDRETWGSSGTTFRVTWDYRMASGRGLRRGDVITLDDQSFISSPGGPVEVGMVEDRAAPVEPDVAPELGLMVITGAGSLPNPSGRMCLACSNNATRYVILDRWSILPTCRPCEARYRAAGDLQ